MISLITPTKARRKLADNIRERRLRMALTQEGLAERAAVPLATLRKFEQQGAISLESFLKLLLVVGGLEEIIEATQPARPVFSTIDDVLNENNSFTRKRGRRK